MRFMMIVKANEDAEAGKLPDVEMLEAMGKYNEELMRAGVLLDLAGLQPTSKGARVRFSASGQRVIDGPFAETKELIGGYWIIRVNSLQEAIDWAKRAPNPHGPGLDAEIEIRPFYELDDFAPPGPATERQRELESKLENQKRTKVG